MQEQIIQKTISNTYIAYIEGIDDVYSHEKAVC